MKNAKISATITKVATIIFSILLLILMAVVIPLLSWLMISPDSVRVVVIAFYICCAPAWIAIFNIFKLMKRIECDDVFSQSTVKHIQILSLCCFLVFAVCGVSGFFYFPLWIFAFGAMFLALILNVLKNVMEKAVEIKSENDMTI